MNGTVYLIHFNKPLRHARHYLGYTEDLASRLGRHENGRGARLMEVITDKGIGWELAATWEGGPELEHWFKRQKNSPRFCPICQQENEAS